MKYTRHEIAILQKHAATHTARQIGEMLGRTRLSVKRKAYELGIKMRKSGDNHYLTKHTDHEIELCRALYDEGLNCRQIAEKMETSHSYVRKIVAHIVRKPA